MKRHNKLQAAGPPPALGLPERPLAAETAREWLRNSRRQYIDWSWRRAEQVLRANEAPDEHLDDVWIERAWQFLQRSRSQGPKTSKLSRVWFTAIAAAVQIREGEAAPRDCLEARLLSGLSHAQVATRSGVTKRAVEAYENLFFCFRPFLKARNWMMAHAVGLPATGGCLDLGTVLKKFAYLGGEQVVEPAIEVYLKVAGGSLVDDLPDGSTASGLQGLLVRRAFALERLPTTARAAKTLMVLHADQIRSPPQSEPFTPGVVSLDKLLANLDAREQASDCPEPREKRSNQDRKKPSLRTVKGKTTRRHNGAPA
jgi:hypothetical protein